jgi:16S rRNA (uracil1498-N3)-methyltransferase
MALPIFFVERYNDENFIMLNEDTSKHVVQVLRMTRGDQLQLTDGKGHLLTAAIEDDHKKKCTVKVVQKTFKARKEQRVSIGISLLKNATRFEWFLEKATEVGVYEIVPLRCDRTEKQHFRFERMNNILVSAMLQSQQVWLPFLHEPVSCKTLLDTSTFETKLIAHCEEEQKHSIGHFSGAFSTQILIGPEGDFTPHEIEEALRHNYKPITLGETRLRAETAGVVAAALLCI